jgi:hypothetical protein
MNLMNIEQANRISLVELMTELGFNPVKVNKANVYYQSPFYKDNQASFRVNRVNNVWFDKGLGKGGDVVFFGRLYHQTSNIKRVLDDFEKYEHFIIGNELAIKPIKIQTVEEMAIISIGELNTLGYLSYLRSRGIDPNIAKTYCLELKYSIKKEEYSALTFKNNSGGYEIHNPYIRCCVGTKDISIVHKDKIGVQNSCCIFDNHMDFLSYKTLEAQGVSAICIEEPCDYIILNGHSNLQSCLERLGNYDKIHCFLHNDQIGRTCTDTIMGLYDRTSINESDRYAEFLSLNRYLMQYR